MNVEMTNDPNHADLGDLLKVVACSAVIMQTILGFAVQTDLTAIQEKWIIGLYDALKFSAPAFIFAILYTTVRTSDFLSVRTDYLPYIRKQWHALFMPTILWTAVYLILTPSLQQHHAYHSFTSFNWQFMVGNAAPHLWYSTMMLQFIILMPFFIWLTRWLNGSPRRQIAVLTATVIGHVWWMALYGMFIFNGPLNNQLYLVDRVLPSFFLYAVLGILVWLNQTAVSRWLRRWWWVLVIVLVLSWLVANSELSGFGGAINFSHAPYLKPSMMIYGTSAIGLICWLANVLLSHAQRTMHIIHIMAQSAYKAFLGHAFWVALLWWSTGWLKLLGLRVSLIYISAWVLSFSVAMFGSTLVGKLRNR